jgi:tRNA (cytidine/uridine-2'-O-)-methyltransferase
MFHLVLFEPEIPPNTGNVIRLVRQHRCEPAPDQAARLSAGRQEPQALGSRLPGSSKRGGACESRGLHERLAGARWVAVETSGSRRYSDFRIRETDALLFGPETRGLPPAVRERIGEENSVFLPMRAGSRSLNLSNAVAIVAYEAWRQLGFAAALTTPSPIEPLGP